VPRPTIMTIAAGTRHGAKAATSASLKSHRSLVAEGWQLSSEWVPPPEPLTIPQIAETAEIYGRGTSLGNGSDGPDTWRRTECYSARASPTAMRVGHLRS